MALTQAPPLAQQLEKIWRGLPDGQLTARECEEAILKATDRQETGDYAWASAIRTNLVSAQALIARPSKKLHEFTYERAETFPEWLSKNGPASDGYREQLQRLCVARGMHRPPPRG
jgi:hypothetical protein